MFNILDFFRERRPRPAAEPREGGSCVQGFPCAEDATTGQKRRALVCDTARQVLLEPKRSSSLCGIAYERPALLPCCCINTPASARNVPHKCDPPPARPPEIVDPSRASTMTGAGGPRLDDVRRALLHVSTSFHTTRRCALIVVLGTAKRRQQLTAQQQILLAHLRKQLFEILYDHHCPFHPLLLLPLFFYRIG